MGNINLDIMQFIIIILYLAGALSYISLFYTIFTRNPIIKYESPIHYWFKLSYAQYLAIPRSVLQSMPIK